MLEGATEFIDELLQYSAQVVVIEPTPETDKPMVRCVTNQQRESCNKRAIHVGAHDEIVEFFTALDAANPRITSVSLDEVVCPDGRCPAVVGEVLTFRDKHHLTTDYASLLIADVDRILRERGIVLDEPVAESDISALDVPGGRR